MQQLILILHVLVSFSLIALVLLQHGKGADVGAAFGSGASNTMFGSQGSTPFLIKITGALAAIFFVTSMALSYMSAPRPQQTSAPVSAPTTFPAPVNTNTNSVVPQVPTKTTN